jgi:alkane 1-monooxygenase
VTRSFWATFPFWIAYLLPPIIVVCVHNRGWFAVAPIALIFVALPVIDALSGRPPLSREAPDLAFNTWFRGVTWGWVPLQMALLWWLIRIVPLQHLPPWQLVTATLSVGATTGAIGMTFAHEMIHRRQGYERAFGNILLASVTYPHFAIEHVRGHHRHVGTPRDPATARLGESVYRFLPRTVWGGVSSAWQIERKRLHTEDKSAWSTDNLMVRYALAEAAIYAAVALVFGRLGVAMFAGQSAVAIVILETINYIEHYGLLRKKVAEKPWEYEPVRADHSWDSPSRVSNWLLINLPRHADHHMSVAKRYQALELLPHAPHLPVGYGAMFLLALVPPLWFRVMNRRVAAARQGTPI